jgi:serine/threonine protein kinase
MIELRKQRYFHLSSQLAQLDHAQLSSLFDESELSIGWGVNQTIVLDQSKIFVKRIPLTSLEHDNLFSTRNLYHLPTYYNYGVGSAGFGAFRELVTHLKTTHWVLNETITTFPLMYHYRIIPFSGQRIEMEVERRKSYVEYWGNSANIEKYVVETWLLEHPTALQHSLEDLRRTIDFLRSKGIIHFDAHFHNVLTDGEQTYLTDFGLVLDKSFALTSDEEFFLDQHTFYDSGEVLWNVGHLIRLQYDLCSEDDQRRMMAKYGITGDLQPYEVRSRLLENIEQIHADGDMPLDAFYIASIVKYRNIITLMQNFFSEMRRNNQKDTKFDHSKLQRLLRETGFIPDENR